MVRFLLLMCFVLAPVTATAHEQADPDEPHVHVIPAAVEKSIVRITSDETYRYITSNGIPNHSTGEFPNRGNPNSISAQDHKYRVPLKPQNAGQPRSHNGIVGIALNGVPFEPGTAECYGRSRGQRGNPNSCEWREEAIVNGRGGLGLDYNNAHVQPTGSYHYHGVPKGLLGVLPVRGDLVHVGYAADGFKMMVSRSSQYGPSYRLKSGSRPEGSGSPGGRYTGKYTADFEYVQGSGQLDKCNGTHVNGEYAYFVTETFPFAPRCLMGQADASFSKRRGGGSQSGTSDNRRRPPPPYRRGL